MNSKWLIGAVLLLPVVVLAQPRERFEDRRDLHKDAAKTWDDKRDLAQLEGILAHFDRARAFRNPRELSAVDGELSAFVRQEWVEAREGVVTAKVEERRDVREARMDDCVGDRRDMHDDRRDLRQEKRDARAEEGFAFRIRAISAQLDPLYGRLDGPSLERKRALVVELIDLGRRQIGHDRHEQREDRRDLRMDR